MEDIFMKYLLPIAILGIILVAAVFIGKFFNLSSGLYLGYILWFIGLVILYWILPQRHKSKFLKKD